MDPSFFQPLLTFLEGRPLWLAGAILLVALAESLALVGIVIPGVVLLFLLATLAGSGLLSLEVTLLVAAVGAILGDGISFILGRVFHERLHGIWPFRRYPDVLWRGEEFFRQHGGKSVVIGRFIGPIRPVIPLVAGMFDMPARQFFVYNLVSALAWSPVYMLPGFLVGASIAVDFELPRHFYLVFFSSLALLLLVSFIFFNLHWQLQPEGHLHRWLYNTLIQQPWSQRLWQRLSSPRSGHTEFPLASLMLFLICLLAFVILAISVMETQAIWRWNQSTHDFFLRLRQHLLDPFFLVITLIGDAQAHYLLFALLGMFFLIRGRFMAAVHVAAAGLAAGFSIELLKNGLEVIRPDAIQQPLGSFAFPSGHTGGAMVFWGLLATFVAQEIAAPRRRRIYLLFAIPPLLVGLSRLYLGVHWLTDVVGGLLWGLVICALTRICYSPFDREPVHVGKTGAAVITGGVLCLLVYVLWTYGDAIGMYALPQPRNATS